MTGWFENGPGGLPAEHRVGERLVPGRFEVQVVALVERGQEPPCPASRSGRV
jgi:hypothetical protein